MIWRLAFLSFLTFPFFIAALWTVAPALQASYAMMTFNLQDFDAGEPGKAAANVVATSNLKIRRQIQRYFLDYHVYIPFEDIFVNMESSDGDRKKLVTMLSKLCGEGKIYIWVPLKFRMPIIGDRIIERCFIPGGKAKLPLRTG